MDTARSSSTPESECCVTLDAPAPAPRFDRADRVAAAVILAQLALLAWAGYGGSFLGDDLMRSTEAARATFGARYLTADVFGHLAPGYRLVFWLQAHTIPLDHDAATSVLLAVQAGTLWLAWRTFRLVLGDGYRSLIPLVVYACSPLAVPSFLWWSSAVNLVPCHLAILAATRWHILSMRTGRRRYVAYATLAVAGGLLFWEKTGLVLVELPLLTLVLLDGPLRDRLRAVAGMWRRWLVYWSPVAVLAVPYLRGTYAAPPTELSAAEAASVVGHTAWQGVLPTLAGGPLVWEPVGFFGVGDAPAWMSWAGLAVLLAVTVVAVRRWRWRALALGAYVVIPFLVGAAVTAYGRAGAFGVSVARDHRYLSDLLPVLTVALALVLRGRSFGPRALVYPGRPPWWSRAAVAALTVGFAGLAATSTVRFADTWHDNPVGTYLANAREGLTRKQGEPLPSIYDSTVSARLVDPLFAPFNRPSGILGALRRPPAYDDPHADLQMLDEQGRLRPARFVVAGSSGQGPNPLCGWGDEPGPVTVPLPHRVPQGHWTVVVYLSAAAPAAVTVEVHDRGLVGEAVVRPDRRTVPPGLVRLYAHVSSGADAVTVTAEGVCVYQVDVGHPVPVENP